MDTNTSNSDDNPFAGPKVQTPGKVSVQMPTDDWLCRKLSKLNITLVEGYPFHSLEAGGFFSSIIHFCVTSIYAAWHIGIASSSKFVASAASSVVVGVVVCRHHTFYSG